MKQVRDFLCKYSDSGLVSLSVLFLFNLEYIVGLWPCGYKSKAYICIYGLEGLKKWSKVHNAERKDWYKMWVF